MLRVRLSVRLFRGLARLFWHWAPHRCKFVAVPGEFVPQGTHGRACKRCGTAIWFNVKG
jgi:hypothetical protein